MSGTASFMAPLATRGRPAAYRPSWSWPGQARPRRREFEATRSALHRLQHAPRRREQRSVAVREAEELKAKRQPAVVENWKRQCRNAEHRAGHGEYRIARGAEADRRGARGRERDAGVE